MNIAHKKHKENFLPLAIIFSAVLISVFIIGRASAQTAETGEASLAGGDGPAISFPIPELGNCKNKSDCKSYCNKPDHTEVCLAFAERNGMMPKEEVEKARKFAAAGGKGPGGCTDKETCEAYCDDIQNIDVCVSFAEKNGMMPEKELEEARKIQAALKRGVKPPACGSKKACDSYCEDPNHIEECVAFASEAGFMSEEEKNGAQKMIQAIKKGVKPPPCRGKEACDQYCGDESHFDECFAFAEAAGFVSAEDATMAKKTRGRGPGGCRGKEACDAFCSQPDNEVSCINFAKENGLMSPERLEEMEKNDQRFKASFEGAPPEVMDCLKNAAGPELVEKLMSGKVRPNAIGSKLSDCFGQADTKRMDEESRGRPGQDGEFRGRPPEGSGEQGFDRQDFDRQKYDQQKYDQNYPDPRMPCQGENCPQGAPGFQGEFQGGFQGRPPEGQTEGTDGQRTIMPFRQTEGYPQDGGSYQGAPESGSVPPDYTDQGGMIPLNTPVPTGEPIPRLEPAPMIQPAPTTQFQPAPTGETAPAPIPAGSPTGSLSRDSMTGSVFSAILNILFFGR